MSLVKNICIQKGRACVLEREGREGISDMCGVQLGVRNQTDLAGWQREAKPGAFTDKNKRTDDKSLT